MENRKGRSISHFNKFGNLLYTVHKNPLITYILLFSFIYLTLEAETEIYQNISHKKLILGLLNKVIQFKNISLDGIIKSILIGHQSVVSGPLRRYQLWGWKDGKPVKGI